MKPRLRQSILWTFILSTLLGLLLVQCSGYTLGTLSPTSWNPVGVVLDDQTTWYWDPSRCKYLELNLMNRYLNLHSFIEALLIQLLDHKPFNLANFKNKAFLFCVELSHNLKVELIKFKLNTLKLHFYYYLYW